MQNSRISNLKENLAVHTFSFPILPVFPHELLITVVEKAETLTFCINSRRRKFVESRKPLATSVWLHFMTYLIQSCANLTDVSKVVVLNDLIISSFLAVVCKQQQDASLVLMYAAIFGADFFCLESQTCVAVAEWLKQITADFVVFKCFLLPNAAAIGK